MAFTKLVSVELYADLVCPWCWIGDRRLWRALAAVQEAHPHVGFDVVWRPFQLDPSLPPEGRDWEEVIENKFGGRARAEPMFARVAEAGAPDGCEFHFDRITRMANTARAHGLVLHAQQTEGDTWALVETIYARHFTEGADLGDADTLRQLGRDAGFSEADLTHIVDEGRYDLDVQQSQREAARLGIQGVPFAVLDGRYGISGAQPEEVFVQALTQVVNE
jgi:predicted DsbA family dithiol-disulfide isomerase